MNIEMSQQKASFPLGKRFAIVLTEPLIRETKFNGKPDIIVKFQARGKSGELIDCMCSHARGYTAAENLQIGQQIMIDQFVEITAIENSLEYKHTGYFILIDPRQ